MTTLMAREIDECGAVVARCLQENAAAFADLAERLAGRAPAVVVTNARGSSDHAALYLKYLIEIALGLPCASIGPSIASLYRAPLKLSHGLAIAISQSGRSPDIVAAQRAARDGGAHAVALVNSEASPLADEADCLIPLRAGPEQSVAATKSMIAALAAGAGLVAAWSREAALSQALGALPDALAPPAPPPQALVETLAASPAAFVLGRGSTFAIAAEAALKLKETCAIHAEAFSSAEVMHGPAELVRPGFLVIAFPPRDEAAEGFAGALDRLRALGARVVTVEAGGQDGPDRLGAAAARHPLLAPIPMLHRFYALAEATARRLGRDPDRPSNLRKVTETR
jgi:glucosamine--fructose-6-phosphate aminotransferase (isomerizing)